MITPATLTAVVFLLSIALVVLLFVWPSLTARREGKIIAFIALFCLPVLCSAVGFSDHMERAKETTFCLSCHIMQPYGQSLYMDDAHYIPAAHFQNHRVPADEACYTCHTDYVLYGGIRAKLTGLHHVYVQYLGKPPAPADIHLYTPYNNRECLHCHAGARSFEESATHMALHDQIVSNQLSCISSGCHDSIHNIAGLANVKMWKEPN